jgi:hypothetical protein
MTSGIRRAAAAGAVAVATLLLSHAGSAQTNGTAERFTAMAVNMERGGSATIEIVVNRWSTNAEREKLMSVLMDKGPDKLLDVLQSMPRVGYFRNLQSIGYDIHYSAKTNLPDGGERVVLATDRRIGFWEASNRPRSIDYPFTVIELHLNGDGEGEGKMSVATKITADKENQIITLENYGTQPVLLQSVKREKASH